MNQTRWGILGCGDVCEIKSGPGFQRAAGSALVAVMRRDAGAAEDFARRHGVPRWYADADALIADDEVDAVYIATPPGRHLELALKVAAAGKPCLVEKPMGRCAEEGEVMTGAFEKAGAPLFVAYYRRCLPRFQKVAEHLGGMGRVREVRYTLRKKPLSFDAVAGPPWRVRAEASGGGLFMDVGCHALDLIDHLCGPLLNVTGFAENRDGRYPAEDHVELRWGHESGGQGLAVFEFTASAEADELRIVAEAGSI
jgi:1,5-anhydro-D-fructose reductase (1,5-anhydro-D-mannitol-forming)